jgi:hypothetical protein
MPTEGPFTRVFESHPLAELFPLLEGRRFTELCADIKANGLVHPIVMHQGKIIDGRNRLRACKEVGCDPVFTEFATLGLSCSVEKYIFSTNIQRRHLTDDQRAAIAMRFREKIAADSKDRQKAAGNQNHVNKERKSWKKLRRRRSSSCPKSLLRNSSNNLRRRSNPLASNLARRSPQHWMCSPTAPLILKTGWFSVR